MGVVTLAERYGGADVTRPVFESMVEEVADRLTKFALIAGAAAHAPNFHLLGNSGTVTNARRHPPAPAALRPAADRTGCGCAIARSPRRSTACSPRGCRTGRRTPAFGRDRADLVSPACAILEAIRRAFPSERLRIADRGLREGLLMNMMREDGVWRRGVRPADDRSGLRRLAFEKRACARKPGASLTESASRCDAIAKLSRALVSCIFHDERYPLRRKML